MRAPQRPVCRAWALGVSRGCHPSAGGGDPPAFRGSGPSAFGLAAEAALGFCVTCARWSGSPIRSNLTFPRTRAFNRSVVEFGGSVFWVACGGMLEGSTFAGGFLETWEGFRSDRGGRPCGWDAVCEAARAVPVGSECWRSVVTGWRGPAGPVGVQRHDCGDPSIAFRAGLTGWRRTNRSFHFLSARDRKRNPKPMIPQRSRGSDRRKSRECGR